MYDQAKQKNEELKTRFYNEADPDGIDKVIRGCPFQDKGEFF